MLKSIPKNISPDLLKILCEMGHSDELVIADGNFPSASHAKNLIRCDATDVPTILDSILTLLPLDEYVDKPVSVMQTGPEIQGEPQVWSKYREIIKKHDKDEFENLEEIERFAFYERAKKAYAIVTTNEGSLYANIILKKGVIK